MVGTIAVAAAVFAVMAPAALGAVSFEAKRDFPSSAPFYLTTGDFNADGVVDVATSSDAGTNFSALLGNGDGTLQAPRNTTGPAQQSGVAAGDFNGDGRDDVVVISISSNDATRFLSQGDGTFGSGAADPVGAAPQDVLVARLDADTDLDIAVASQTGDNVTILLNDGGGNFTSGGSIAHGLPGNPDGIAAADFDTDGDNDLAIGTTGGGEVAFARNQGPATFDAPVGLGTEGQKLTAGDFNRDGRPDIAAARTANGNVAMILRNAANTGFDPATTFDPEPTAVNAISQLTGADLDGDGNLDLAIPHVNGPQAGKVSVATGRGNGQFDLNGNEPVDSEPREVVAADFNRDGNLDLATSNSGTDDVSVLLAVPPAVTITPTGLAFGDQQQGAASAEQSFTVRNDGVPRLRVGSVALGGANSEQFSISRDTCTGANLAVGESCEVGATFQPTGVGARGATVTVASNGGGAPHAVQLTGTGTGVAPPPPGDACANVLGGTPAADRLNGTAAGDEISGLGGDDVLKGLAGDDCIAGGAGDDRGKGGSGDDRLSGGRGSDRMAGGNGDDRVKGAAGDDRLSGGPGRNRISGGSGDDTINSKNGQPDRVSCGKGRDKVRADRRDDLNRCERV